MQLIMSIVTHGEPIVPGYNIIDTIIINLMVRLINFVPNSTIDSTLHKLSSCSHIIIILDALNCRLVGLASAN
jgi:hypothetical protein